MTVGVATIVHAQQNGAATRVDAGKYEYDAHCAICHGLSGKGDGPFGRQVKFPAGIPDLTTLSKKNNGVFPFERVYEITDGRQQIQAHGPKNMPIWGSDFTAEGSQLNPYYDVEAFARAKILALTEYVYRLQAK
jgi:mono/diheme cytochrome c family protein